MKTATLYASLTLPQRLRAMVSAFGRADNEEFEKLTDSADTGCYSVRKVKHHLGGLAHLAAIHNTWLLEPCAKWLFSQTISAEEARHFSAGEVEVIQSFRIQSLVEAASIEAAFTARLTAVGIAASDWQAFRERFLGAPAKHLLELFLPRTAGRQDPVLVAQCRDAIEGYLFKDTA